MLRGLGAAAAALAAVACATPAPDVVIAARADDAATFRRWAFQLEEAELAQLRRTLAERHPAAPTVIRGATIVSPRDPSVAVIADIWIDDGQITRVAAANDGLTEAGAREIAAAGGFAAPGFVDMHVHELTSSSQPILNVLHGVTSVRDMDGFAWTLRSREELLSGALFGPTPYVAGTILADHPMSWYAEVVETPEAARAAVRAQVAVGYDFIKIHNNMSGPILDAVFDEAARADFDVVGHVPHDIAVATAIDGGVRTIEHLKGYIVDQTLEPSEDDYVAPTRGAEVWNTPTLVNAARSHLRGAPAEAVIAATDPRKVSPLALEEWREEAGQPVDALNALRNTLLGKEQAIVGELHAISGRFLAGTDSGGGYPFMTFGDALLVEMRLLVDAGLTPFEAFRAATLEPAIAMRREAEFGAIEPGLRADVVVLRADPRVDVAAWRDPLAVCVRGACLDHEEIDRVYDDLAAIFARTGARLDAGVVRASDVEAWLATMRALHADGHVFRGHQLNSAARLLRAAGLGVEADEVLSWKTDLDFESDDD